MFFIVLASNCIIGGVMYSPLRVRVLLGLFFPILISGLQIIPYLRSTQLNEPSTYSLSSAYITIIYQLHVCDCDVQYMYRLYVH